ncbi:MAG: bifunctional polysaccharide deacetylase/glycosyltransferase family 2 protein [Patescibacteria group bacterium]|nr:bifunctional polysaccharide deacetylase/glycosyltransferase family 2 protein [bacterium]MDZ4240605.1 bifunctional polysaccharide deacetylase/glycosyltransferase family 2 protein [Patescibacteria group bacterium]
MNQPGKVIFHDESRSRKKVFRGMILFLTLLAASASIFAFFDLVSNTHYSSENFNTIRYYNYYFSERNDKKISITFDDGPDPVYTEKILSVLDAYNVPATFFFVGREVLTHPWLVKKVASRGYEIGNHTFTHSEDVHLSEQRVKWELGATSYVMTILTGKTPLFYRPPYLLDIGIDPTSNPYVPESNALQWMLEYGYIPVGSDVDSKDYEARSVEDILTHVRNDLAQGGRIALFHDGGAHDVSKTIEALPVLIETLRAEGYTFVPLSDVLIPPATPQLTYDLAFGSLDVTTEGQVSLLQEFLVYDGYLERQYVTGTFDEITASALFEWQSTHAVLDASKVTNMWEVRTDEATRALISSLSTNAYTEHKLLNREPALYSYPRAFVQGLFYFIGISLPLLKKGFFIVTFIVALRVLFIFFMLLVRRLSDRKAKQTALSWCGNVSVIIPAYNEEENIQATVMSILSNSYKVDDIIVVDDGSKDRTAERVKKLKKQYPGRITLISQKNAGKAAGLNKGIARAKHDIVITLDGDAIFSKTAIEHLIAPFTDPKVGATAGTVLTANTGSILDLFQRIEYISGQYLEKYALNYFGATGVVPGPIGAWRKSVIKEVGGYSLDTVVEDQDITLAVQAAGYKIIYAQKAIAYTETPFTMRDFFKQRFRWTFGTFQCFWKYKGYFGNKDAPQLSYVILPNVALFGIILPVFFPLMDIMFLAALLFGITPAFIKGYLLFTFFDVLYASCALFRKIEYTPLVFLVPIQRLFYRVVMFNVIIKSYVKMIEGTYAFWNKVLKKGEAQAYFEKVALVRSA